MLQFCENVRSLRYKTKLQATVTNLKCDLLKQKISFASFDRGKSFQAIVTPLEPRPSRLLILATILAIWTGQVFQIWIRSSLSNLDKVKSYKSGYVKSLKLRFLTFPLLQTAIVSPFSCIRLGII